MLKHLLSALRLGLSRLIADNPWWLVTLCLATVAGRPNVIAFHTHTHPHSL